jgi:hypothetical protein
MSVESSGLTVEFPRDGDVLNRHDGVESSEALVVEMRGKAWSSAQVTADGQETVASADGSFSIPVRITQREQTVRVVAQSPARSETAEVRVVWDRASRPRFRFSVDDNILFLRDLSRRPDDYPSLFDHWYLRFWRDMHQQYGAKIHINIYLTDGEEFSLDQMSDKWRGEWQDNAGWLHLSFHARADQPSRIYKDATYEEMARDIARVHQQILRFAGEEVMSAWTTVHWAECPRDAARAVRDAGYRGLVILARSPGDTCTTKYYLSAEQCEHIAGRDAWKDFDMDLTFVQCDQVVNSVSLEQVQPLLEQVAANPHTGELIELLIHEQYFRPDLERLYQPDAMEKVRAALEFVAERGYEPVFWSDELLSS